MSNKISITLDVSKINKSKIVDRKYVNKAGVEVVQKQYKIDVIPVKEVSVISQGTNWVMKKTHFVVEQQTKDERLGKVPSVYVGEGFTFESKEVVPPQYEENQASTGGFDYPDEEVELNEIPF